MFCDFITIVWQLGYTHLPAFLSSVVNNYNGLALFRTRISPFMGCHRKVGAGVLLILFMLLIFIDVDLMDLITPMDPISSIDA